MFHTIERNKQGPGLEVTIGVHLRSLVCSITPCSPVRNETYTDNPEGLSIQAPSLHGAG